MGSTNSGERLKKTHSNEALSHKRKGSVL